MCSNWCNQGRLRYGESRFPPAAPLSLRTRVILGFAVPIMLVFGMLAITIYVVLRRR
jgi:hypothetical protein